ncbi:MAG: hypothetical protein KDA28_06545, partial [Phycisphaerales bacterium]|nr:hypothetical protein [Phycisphaerales bacterium]
LVALGRGLSSVPAEWVPFFHRTTSIGAFSDTGLPAGELEIVTASSTHAPSHAVTQLEEDPATLNQVQIPLAPGGAAQVDVRTPDGEPWPDLLVTLVAPMGRSLSGRTDESGSVRFVPVAPGPWAALATPGAASAPIDSWEWVTQDSGGRQFEVEPGSEARVDWTLPAPVPWEADLEIDGDVREVELRVIHVGSPVAPGVWPDLDLGSVRVGRIAIDRMFPGRYRAVAAAADRVRLVDFEVQDGTSPSRLRFVFSSE